MSKAKKSTPINNRLSASCADFQIEVEFEGKIYAAQCSTVALTAFDKFRCRITYNDVPPITFGIYSSSTLLEIEEDAKLEFIALLASLSKERRIPKQRHK